MSEATSAREDRAEREERVKAQYAKEGAGKSAPAKAKDKKLKGKTNVAVVKKGAVPEGKISVEAAEKKLSPLANEINVRFEKASKLDGQADDHRLAAALRLNEAKQLCAASGIRFREWVEKEVKEQSWETVRKLAVVGGAPNPQIALEDMRGKNKEANKKHREKKKIKETAQKVFGPAEALLAAKPEEALKAARAFAAEHGLEVVSKTEAKELRQKAKSAEMKTEEPLTLDALKAAFNALPARAKMDFVRFAAGEVGGKFVSAIDESDPVASKGEGDDLGIPAGLRRSRKL